MRLIIDKNITVAVFGSLGLLWNFCWLRKNCGVFIRRSFYRQKAIKWYPDGRSEGNSHGKIRVWIEGFVFFFHYWFFLQLLTIKISTHRSKSINALLNSAEVLLELLIEEFKLIVVGNCEIENLNVDFEDIFGIFGGHESEAKKKNVHIRRSVLGSRQDFFQKTRKSCHHYLKETLIYVFFGMVVKKTAFYVYRGAFSIEKNVNMSVPHCSIPDKKFCIPR